MMGIQSVKICSAGLNRSINQDRVANLTNGDCGLYLVADGMGGHYAGEQASQALVNSYADWWLHAQGNVAQMNLEDVATQLRNVLNSCNARIFHGTPENEICGSTLVLLFVQREKYVLLSVGDSRCYQVSGKILPHVQQLTYDDTHENGKLTQAVGSRENCGCQMQTGRAAPGTIFALCSDGLYKYCPDPLWRRCLVIAFISGNIQKALSRASGYVQDHGAKDNYSLVLIRI